MTEQVPNRVDPTTMTYDRYDLEDEFGDDLDDIAMTIRMLRQSEPLHQRESPPVPGDLPLFPLDGGIEGVYERAIHAGLSEAWALAVAGVPVEVDRPTHQEEKSEQDCRVWVVLDHRRSHVYSITSTHEAAVEAAREVQAKYPDAPIPALLSSVTVGLHDCPVPPADPAPVEGDEGERQAERDAEIQALNYNAGWADAGMAYAHKLGFYCQDPTCDGSAFLLWPDGEWRVPTYASGEHGHAPTHPFIDAGLIVCPLHHPDTQEDELDDDCPACGGMGMAPAFWTRPVPPAVSAPVRYEKVEMTWWDNQDEFSVRLHPRTVALEPGRYSPLFRAVPSTPAVGEEPACMKCQAPKGTSGPCPKEGTYSGDLHQWAGDGTTFPTPAPETGQ